MKPAKINSSPEQKPFVRSSATNFDRGKRKNGDIGDNIFTINNLLFGILLALLFHIIFVIAINSDISLTMMEFWLFFFFDTILQGITIVPIIAIIRKQIAWYDPICLLSIMFLSMTAGVFPCYLADPSYYLSFLTFSGLANLGIGGEADFFLAGCYAEIVLFIFIVVVYFINRRSIKISPIRTGLHETRYVIFFALSLFLIGLFAFSRLWTFQSYLEAITVNIGTLSVKSPTLGSAYLHILAGIGISTLSMGMIGLLFTNTIKGRIPRSIIIGLVTLISLMPILYGGSRITIVATIYVIIALIAWFDLKVDWGFWIAIGIGIILLVVAVTVLRGNPLLSSQPEEVINQLVSGEAINLYNQTGNQSFLDRNIVNLDRVGAVILITKYIDNGKPMLYGESMAAGLLNTIYPIGLKIGLITSFQYNHLLSATDQLMTWVIGYKPLQAASLPPSIPGEFYMQGGLFGVVFLSFLFGWLILWLRRRCAKSENLVMRWIFVYITLQLMILTTNELEGISERLIYYLPFWLCIALGAWFLSNFKQRTHV